MNLSAIDFEAIFRASPNCYVVLSPDFTILDANGAYLRTVGRTREELLGRNIFEAFPDNPENPGGSEVGMVRASLERARDRKIPDPIALIRYAIPRDTPEGVVFDERYWSAVHTPLLGGRGEVEVIFQHTQDVTEVQVLRNALRKSELADAPPRSEGTVLRHAEQLQETNRILDAEQRHLRRLFQQAPTFTAFLRGPLHVFELVNDAYLKLIGHRDVIGKPIREALPEIAAQGFIDLLDRVYATGEPFVGRLVPVTLDQNGESREVFLDFIYQPIIIEAGGEVSGIFVQGYDVTLQKRATDELREYHDRLEELVRERTLALHQSEAERHAAEASLMHLQKLEAVGQLTGGVAHDFNNVLQVIGGNLQLLRRDLVGQEVAQRRIQAAIGGVERGARLASQLLAFARRQPLEPVVTNLDRLLRRMEDLFRRTLGEAVEIETVIAEGLWNTFVDPHHLENVILNLAINARDAMAGVGTLRLELANATLDERDAALNPESSPGEYVRLVVSDTGSGMPKEVLDRAFEPFFTTKPPGQGTGLGLSMTYGFVKQSGGHVRIDSEEERGTAITIFLPRASQREAEVIEPLDGRVEGGTETLLVVEDDAAVRATVVELLGDLGYRVLKAPDAQSALAIIASGIPIELLFTDVVMPGPLRSTDLVREAKTYLPNLEVLFTSGYPEEAIVHAGRLDPGVNLLSKPYSREELARKLRHILRNRQNALDLGAALPDKPAPATDGRLRILLVEDHEEMQLLVTESIETLGHEVTAFSNAEQALAALQAESYDVLFTDVGLPGMSGLDLAARAAEIAPNTRRIIASGYGDSLPETDAIVLTKPYSLADVQRVLAGSWA